MLPRANAMCGLGNLTSESANRKSMWKDPHVKTVLVAALKESQPELIREHAIRGLATLAVEPKSFQ